MGVSELRELRQLREENARLKRLVADLTLDKQILTDVVKKSFEAGETSGTNALDGRSLSGQRTEGLQLRMRMRRRKHRCLHRGVVPKATHPHQRLSMDFVHDQLFDARPFRF